METIPTSKCPTCKKPSDEKYRPFCSKRCAEIDLAHWLRGDYKIESHEEEGPEKQQDERDEGEE